MSSRTAVLHQIDHIQRLRSRPVNLVDGTIVRVPPDWFQMVATQSLNNSSVDEIVMKAMEASTGDVALAKLDHFCDGENIDALEHFFWGQTNGIAMEIGALDGSQETRSMTFDLEQSFGWRRDRGNCNRVSFFHVAGNNSCCCVYSGLQRGCARKDRGSQCSRQCVQSLQRSVRYLLVFSIVS
jgi:hypothetical protein